MRTYTYRLYPNSDQRRRLDACLHDSRQLYNEMLQRQKEQYKRSGTFLRKYSLHVQFAGRGGVSVPASTVQCLANRLDKAFKAFLALQDEGWGFPRFKSANQWHSIQLRQLGSDFTPTARTLKVPSKLGNAIKLKMHRPLMGMPKTCYLVKRADKHWYALIVCDLPKNTDAVSPLANTGSAVGIDVGLKVFIADSDGHTVENPRFFRTSQTTLHRKQRRLCSRQKGSHRRRKMARSVAQTHLKIERQRRDFHFKTAKRYVNTYATIVVEDLNVRGLARSRLAKSVLDAAWGAFLTILTCKAVSAGGQVIRINPCFTTQDCSRCRKRVQKSLSVRTHRCPVCGYIADRDVNAALNILKAGAPPSGTLADGLAVEPRSSRA